MCDLLPASAERAATLAEHVLGVRPRVFATFADMHAALDLDAISITTMPEAHVDLGVEALAAGVHVMVEKPISLTVREGVKLVDAAARANRKLAVAENYRRDPINRLAEALLDAGAIGTPFLAVQASSGSGENVIITPWRHLKKRCGIVVDMGVHYTDMLEYFLGAADDSRRYAMRSWTKRAKVQMALPSRRMRKMLSVGTARFANGAIANWLLSVAGRGAGDFIAPFTAPAARLLFQ